MYNFIILKQKDKVIGLSNYIQNADDYLLNNSGLFQSKMLYFGYRSGFSNKLTSFITNIVIRHYL